jgi:hypothetical protein
MHGLIQEEEEDEEEEDDDDDVGDDLGAYEVSVRRFSQLP